MENKAITFCYELDRKTVRTLFDCIQYRIDRLDEEEEEESLQLEKVHSILNIGWPTLNKEST